MSKLSFRFCISHCQDIIALGVNSRRLLTWRAWAPKGWAPNRLTMLFFYWKFERRISWKNWNWVRNEGSRQPWIKGVRGDGEENKNENAGPQEPQTSTFNQSKEMFSGATARTHGQAWSIRNEGRWLDTIWLNGRCHLVMNELWVWRCVFCMQY